MRPLNRLEEYCFESAFNFLDRLGTMYYADVDLGDIRIVKYGSINTLPFKIITFVEEIGGLKELNKHFNPFAKPKTFPHFIKRLYDKGEQPRDYFADGLIVTLEKINHETIEFKG